MQYIKIFIIFFLSQLVYVGVFGLSEDSYYVVNIDQNLCGEFTKGTAQNPNWLPENWKAIFLIKEGENNFLQNISCLESDIVNCCISEGYRYAGVPIGIEEISDERKGAEILASKKIIETQSFQPGEYSLRNNISRKEVMKIVMNISEIEVQDSCREIFADVQNDWGCKYIEAALENKFIAGNQSFRPDSNITKTEALKLIFKAKGIEKAYSTDFWQEDYISTAYYYGYIDTKYSNYNEIATRGWIFSVAGKTYPEFSKY